MPFETSKQSRHLDYFLLHHAKATGPSVGMYANGDIPETVVDDFGRHYIFSGIAPRRWNGEFDLDALRAGEFILKPGLVYQMKNLPRTWLEALLR